MYVWILNFWGLVLCIQTPKSEAILFVSVCVILRTRKHVTDLREYKIVWQVDWVLVIPSCFIGHYCFHGVVVVHL